jgi:alkylation response protein AidB-like acyl-CoA dehydrogenase
VEKTPRGYSNPLRDNAATQSDVAQAEVALRAARTHLMQSIAEICAEVQRAGQITMDQRMALRLATTYAIHQATQVCDFAYTAAGASAVFLSNPFERRFRDVHAISQQLQGRKSHYQTVGKFLMGGEAETAFL